MSDVYTPPPDTSYFLVTSFWMPSNIGDRWAVSFTGNSSTVVAAALSIVVTVSFLCLWNFITFIAVLGVPKATRHRYVAVVTIWNSNDPWFAFKELLHYTYRQAAQARISKKWTDIWYGLLFCLLALAVFGTSIAMGIVAPSLVQIGNVAPVRPSTVFYPVSPASSAEELRDFGLRAPSVMRALGSIEAAAVTLREKVTIKENPDYDTQANGERNVGLDYEYSLSGVDLGISGGSDLSLVVKGHCMTEYGWSRDPPEDEDITNAADEYYLWNDPLVYRWVDLNKFDIAHAPFAAFFIHPNASSQIVAGDDMLYIVLVHSAWRSSITNGDDPWYATEPRNPPDVDSRYNAAFRMKRRRPVLSCGEKNSWTYAGQAVASVVDLKNIPDIKIPQVLLEILETTLSGGPMVVRLGNASGDSALRSRTTSPNGVIDAGSSSMFTDMERLILASYAATRNIFTDAVMFGQPDNYGNLVEGPDGQPREGAGNFVVQSPDIQTFSLTGIVVLLVILAALILLNCLTSLLIHFNHQPTVAAAAAGDKRASTMDGAGTSAGTGAGTGDGISTIPRNDANTPPAGPPRMASTTVSQVMGNKQTPSDKWNRFHVLSANQLFRCVYEPEEGRVPRENWSCDTSDLTHYATDEEPFALYTCESSKCMGHIRKKIEVPNETNQNPGHEDVFGGRDAEEK